MPPWAGLEKMAKRLTENDKRDAAKLIEAGKPQKGSKGEWIQVKYPRNFRHKTCGHLRPVRYILSGIENLRSMEVHE